MLRAALVVATLVMCVACSSVELSPDASTAALPAATAVPATVWFRIDERGTSMLAPAERSLPREGDPVRHALEELIEGPAPAEGKRVVAPDLKVERVDVRDGTAWVELEGDLQPPFGEPPTGPTAPMLGLAAIANTLTEFPSVQRVRLDVDGRAVLGGWGVPDLLVRDETFEAPGPENDPSSPLSIFSREPRSVGLAEAAQSVPRVVGIRVLDRLGYVRIAVELSAPEGGDVPVIPVADAWGDEDGMHLSIAGAVPADGLPTSIDGPAHPVPGQPVVDHVDVHVDDTGIELLVRGPAQPAPMFALLTDVSPSRILLDVKK